MAKDFISFAPDFDTCLDGMEKPPAREIERKKPLRFERAEGIITIGLWHPYGTEMKEAIICLRFKA